MKKQFIGILLCFALLLALSLSAAAVDAPELDVAGDGGISAAAGEGSELFLASYDPVTGQFLGFLDPAGETGGGNVLLKAIQSDGDYRPVSESRSVLVISEGGTEYEGGVYDEVVVTSALGEDTVTLRNMTVQNVTLYGGDVTLEAVTLGDGGASLMAESSGLSIRIVNNSGVGSVRIGQTGDGGVFLRTEEGCRVSWVCVDDGQGAIYLEGAYNQVVVDTDTPVTLTDATVSGLSLREAGASVALEGDTRVSAVQIQEDATGAGITAEAGTRITSMDSQAENAAVSGEGTVLRAQVSGSGTSFDTTGTYLTVAEGTQGVTQNGSDVEAGETVKTGDVDPGGEPGGEPEPPAPEGHAHVWVEGVCTEATPETEGTVTYVCEACGETTEGVVSYLPFAIFPEDGEPQWFRTLEEALEEAQKHPYHNEPGEDPWTEYEAVHLIGAATIHDLELPAGCLLFVQGKLTLTGSLTLGASDYPECPGMGAGRIFIPDFDEAEVTLNGVTLFDGDAQENGVYTIEEAEDPEAPFCAVSIFGCRGYSEDPYAKPWISFLDGDTGRTCRIQKDYDFTQSFDGVVVNNAEVQLAAAATLENYRIWNGSLLLTEGGAFAEGGRKVLGFGEDCDIQVTSLGGGNTPASVVLEEDRVIIRGGNALVRRDAVLGNLGMEPYIGDPNTYTLTVAEGATLSLQGNDNWLPEGVTLVNDGTVELYGSLYCSDGVLINNGVFRLKAYQWQESEWPEDDYAFGSVVLNRFRWENYGSLLLEEIRFTNSWGDDDGRCAEFYANLSSCLLNAESGAVTNNGFLFFRRDSRLENRGELHNLNRLEMEVREELWTQYEDAEAECILEGGACALVNSGYLENGGELWISGSDTENSGTLWNTGRMELQGGLNVKEYVVLRREEGEPQTDEEWELFWDWVVGESAYWRTESDERTVLGVTPASLTLTGEGALLENSGEVSLQNIPLLVGEGAELINEGSFHVGDMGLDYVWWTSDREEALGEHRPAAPEVVVEGVFRNGVITDVGDEFSGSDAWYGQEGGSFLSRGAVTANGHMDWDGVAYSQTAEARLENYNASGLEIRSGSLTVPSGAAFENEGYMRITDRYGEDFSPCDLSGFEDFFTTWNLEGNDSHWCDVAAEVYDEEGYWDAVEEQHRRSDVNRNTRYNRLDFCGDVTFTEDVRFEDFGWYWVNKRQEERWAMWIEEEDRWIELESYEEGADRIWITVPTTLTVAEGATLTVAPDNSLAIEGERHMMTHFTPNLLLVEGTLVLEPGQEGCEENDWNWTSPGEVQIWSFGSFDASRGQVENDGRFEIRYFDMGHGEEPEEGEFLYVSEGIFARPEECPVIGAPENAEYAAEVRSEAGLRNAAASQDPVFSRLYLREDCVVTLAGADLTVPMDVNVEPGSGLIVEYGCALTLGGHLWNDGDTSIYGDLVISETGSADNNQSISIGAFSSEEGRLLLHGYMTNRGHAELRLDPSGSIVLYGGCEFWNEAEPLPVTLEGTPWRIRGARLGELTFSGEDGEYCDCVFEGALTVVASPDDWCSVRLDNCEFLEDVTVDREDGSGELWVEFYDNARFAEGKKVLVTGAGDLDLEAALEHNCSIMGARDLTIESEVSLWVGCRMPSVFTLNGVTVELQGPEDGFDLNGGASLRFELWEDETPHRVFQADSDDRTVVKLSGALTDFDELRLMQGGADISELDTGDADITLHNDWESLWVNIGSHSVTACEWGEHGFSVTAESGAEILVRNAVMRWDEEEDRYGYSTGVHVEIGEESYELSPHIFGTRDGREPGVYIGTDDEGVTYGLRLNGEPLSFLTDYHSDQQEKTHLWRPEDEAPWFTAGENDFPDLELIISLPQGVTVIFAPVPVKPEWREPEP